MHFAIRNRWTHEIKFTAEIQCDENASPDIKVRLAIRWAIETGANLRDADLRDADLRDANLTRANLTGANLTRANLRDANLRDANLTGANLTGADLTRADLTRADLTGADLTGANLTGADLTGADLTGADLTGIRDDLFAVLSTAPTEVPALIAALAEGRVDGSTYEGSCACLVGTLAHARGGDENCIEGLVPNSWRPAERFFMGIKKGDTPETNPVCKLAHDWSVEWLDRMKTAFATPAACEVAR